MSKCIVFPDGTKKKKTTSVHKLMGSKLQRGRTCRSAHCAAEKDKPDGGVIMKGVANETNIIRW